MIVIKNARQSLAYYRYQHSAVQSGFTNRGRDDCGASSSIAAALCGAACGTRGNSGAVLSGNVYRRGLRGRPRYGNHGGPDRRLEPGRCRPEVLGGPLLRRVQQ